MEFRVAVSSFMARETFSYRSRFWPAFVLPISRPFIVHGVKLFWLVFRLAAVGLLRDVPDEHSFVGGARNSPRHPFSALRCLRMENAMKTSTITMETERSRITIQVRCVETRMFTLDMKVPGMRSYSG